MNVVPIRHRCVYSCSAKAVKDLRDVYTQNWTYHLTMSRGPTSEPSLRVRGRVHEAVGNSWYFALWG
jgi:hypothetical protein